ncbi:type I polyketide synthase [Saccharothrix syringae]|uniref:Type I polyketide synthase n=1 Tax=Saccharothrix syringae TaxID=103733 RepID=A0A5Q0HEN7_SACSY|nr:type I polyketide synthase [Saccharothrix syringae]
MESIVVARREDVALRLFAFPHAGGDHHAFADWPSGLPEDVEVVAYSLPGRGRDWDKSPHQRWDDLVDDLADLVLRHWDGTPFAFFGHSFGALVAFEVCRRLADQGRRTPEVLFVSAHCAPHLSGRDRARFSLPESEFLDLVRAWGLVPEGTLADEELLRIVLPPLRADLKLDDEYVAETGAVTGRTLPVSCVVYGGADDRTVDVDELQAWREHFSADIPFDLELFPGGHFYTISARPALLDSIGRHLDRAKTRIGPSITLPGSPYPDPGRSIWARFREQVASAPDALALVDHPRRWTYRELADSATALASELAALGVGKGDVVGLLFPRSAEYCVSLLTCLGTGSPACLLEKNWPTSLLAEFLENAGVEIVLTTAELAELLPLSFRTPDRHLVLTADRRRDPPPVEFPDVAPGDTALISMTSGTSGTPKAVLNTHLGCLYCFDARYELYPYQESSCEGLNAFFAWECIRPLLQGRPAVVIPDDHIVDPVRLIDTIVESRITRVVVPPSLFESVLDHPFVGPSLAERLAHMEVWFLMGEVVPNRIVDKAAALLPPHVRLVNSYSTWECLDISFADLLPARPDETVRSPFARVGRLLDGSAAVLLNADGEPVPLGGVGELHFAGPGVGEGYLNDPRKTAERFVPCPDALRDTAFADATFYRTGDRARFLPDGELEVLGRAGDVVKVRGFKVSLRAVEHVLADQPGIARVVVRAVLDSRTNQPTGLLAYLLGEEGRPSETMLARSRLKAKRDLPEYARPRHFIGLDSLPISKSDSRKLDLSALPPPPAEEDEDGPADALTTMERRIARAWQEVLGLRRVEADDNFFDVGGDSLSAARLSGVLAERFGISLAVVDVFQFSTLSAMAAHCSRREADGDAVPARRPSGAGTTKLAVVGMAGRFPGASTIEEFWENLKNGTDSLTEFSSERLRDKGVPEHIVNHPEWVAAGQVVADADKFDAQFWGIGRSEAVIMDPQHRVFVETAWSALEQAGYARRDNPYRRRTGVFAACGIDGYLIHHLAGGGLKDPLDPTGLFLTEIGNEKDYIATRVAYLLDLGGPAMTVTSACSSALVAVAQAAQAITSGQCDMAIAGGSSLTFPNFGYRYADGLVGSADGRVRPFDDGASGTLFGDSVGAVVLKRLDDALADGDHVWAVLTGFGVSNDGRMKAGYAAPSARAQAQCISDAIEMAGIDAERISYVECHATATHVGDAIEVKALLDAFTAHRAGDGFTAGSCAIGSVKGNIGHANCAAGITGFIKTVLCLHHRVLTPTVNYRTLNPKLVDFVDADGSPFTVQETCREWAVTDPRTQLPRRAGVSSFGIGGTNAHVILEEAPERAPDEPSSRSLHLVTVSARGEGPYHRNATALARFLEGVPEPDVAPAIRSSHVDREAHPLRGSAVIASGSLDELRALAEHPPHVTLPPGHVATVAFSFSGQGSQAAGMARGLYRGRGDGGRFRWHFDAVGASLARHLPEDPVALILGADDESVQRPVTTQCGLFAVEYALAMTLTDIGVRPVAVAGHSIGEYAAAVAAGVLALDEASALVAVRARATEDMLAGGSVGGMLSVVGDEDLLADWLDGRENLWWAVENSFGRIVLSGTEGALLEAAEALPALGFTVRRVPVSHPFHSDLMAPVAERLDAAASGLEARSPIVPLAANLTGTWLDSRYRPRTYWAKHVTSTVRWREDVAMLLKWEPDVVLEIGPGNVLTSLTAKILRHRGETRPLPVATMPDVKNGDRDDEVAFLRVLGELWCRGVDLDFAAFHEGERSIRRLLPTYSFEPTSYWTNPSASIHVDPRPQETAPAPTPLVRFAAKPDARVRLYCFPYAGGNSGAFRSWARTAPSWLDVIAVELPGRDAAAGAAEDDAAVLEELARHIRADAGSGAVAFCGLSFGASLALDLLGGPLSDWARQGRVTAVVAVGRAPLAGGADPAEPESYLMVPDELRDDPAWRRSVLPVLRADLAFDARSARRAADRGQVLECPLQVHCATDDPSFPLASATEWAAITTSPVVDVHTHPGAHDFMLHRRDAVLERITAFLGRLDPVDPGPGLHEVRWVPAGRAADAPDVPWTELAPDAARFFRDHLTGPRAHAALLCPPSADAPPTERCAVLLELLKSLLRAESRGRLVLVLPADADSGLATGITRSLAHEEPGLTVQRVYVQDWPADRPAWVGPLLRAARSHPDETDLVWRGGHLLAQRLLPVPSPDLPPGTLGGATGSYLVTGGTGGIGRVVVDWLIHHQHVAPERVVVSGRTDPGVLRPGVRFVPIDFARPLDVPVLANDIGPLAGIFHLAGALDDGVLRNLDASRFDAVLAPKLALADLAGLGAPWTVAFSSTSALLGAAGQANYAAANAWMDAYARWTADAPGVVTVDWGTWGEVGMAARSAKALNSARAAGEAPLASETALNLLGKVVAAVLSGASGRVFAACDVDWSREPWVGLPLVVGLPTWHGAPRADSRPPGRAAGEVAEKVVGLAAEPVTEVDPVREFLSAYVYRWDESELLADLGLDSLDFVRIRGDFARAFGEDVPLAEIARPDRRLDELHSLLSGRRGAGKASRVVG